MMVLASSLGKTWCVRSSLATWCMGGGGGGAGDRPPLFFISIEKKKNERYLGSFDRYCNK